jgi:hypothetical protein
MKKSILVVIILIFCTFSCAKRVLPSGGEGDKMPPRIIEIFPSNQSIFVDKNAKFTIKFSKWIDPQSLKKGIAVSPNTEFSIKVKGKIVEIIPKTPLKSDISYHISFLGEIFDYSKNSLTETQTIIFSTGDFIDTGYIEGRVFFDKSNTETLPKIALFFKERAENGDSVLLSTPDYITQADSLGNFRFNNIMQSKYRIIGFSDKNRDNKITPLEIVFISSEKITETQSFVELLPATCDTVQNKILSATAISPDIVLLKMNSPEENSFDSLEIFSESDNQNIRIKKTEKVSDNQTTAIFLDDSLQNKMYVIETKTVKIFVNDGDSTFHETTKFNGTTMVDTIQMKKLNRLLSSETELSDSTEKENAVTGDSAELCPKLSWNFFGELPDNPLWKITDKKLISYYTSDGFLENIPAGKYSISLIDDKNNNKKYDMGTLFPFVCGEKIITFPDTLSARDRWEAEYDIKENYIQP